MEPIYERTKEEIISHDITEIDESLLFRFFLQDTHRTMYVTEKNNGKDKLTGIITLGNFRRNQLKEMPLINHSFRSFDISHETDAVQVLQENEKIWSVPIVDENGVLVKEYYKQPEPVPGISFEMARQMALNSMLVKQEKVLLVIEGLSKEERNEIYSVTDGKVMVADKETDWEKLFEPYAKDDIFIYDCSKELYKIRKLIYNKYNVKNEVVFAIESTYEGLTQLAKLYRNIAIFNIKDDLLKEKIPYTKLLEYNELIRDKEEYYYPDLEEDIECIMMPFCPFAKPYVIINGKCVPIVSEQYLDLEVELTVGLYDVAFYIVPQLLKNGVQCIVVSNPDKEKAELHYSDMDEIEGRGNIEWNCREIIEVFFDMEQDEAEQFFDERFSEQWKIILRNGYKQFPNVRGKYFNYTDGERYTCGNPTEFENTMFLFGPCTVWGTLVDDKHTLGSYLRKRVDERYYIKNCGMSFETIHYAMRNQKYKPGDMAIIFAYDKEPFERNHIPVDSVIEAYKKIPDLKNHVTDSVLHCNKRVTKNIAEEVYDLCEKHHCFDAKAQDNLEGECRFGRQVGGANPVPEGLERWLASVEQYKVQNTEHAGAIVMNCNPFTRGHRYLIQQASQQVDVLYIFVVEENKSFFDFQDRLHMVKLGVADLENVVVIPSGKYMISTVTLPGYFEKETCPFAEFDATEDLVLFADVIAKRFDIRVRFAGEEPKDAFTNRYNESMGRILPEHGVNFVEIPRMCLENEVVSASLVRKYMAEGRWEEIQKLVLPEIYAYLWENYREEC